MLSDLIKKKVQDGNMTLEGLAWELDISRTTLYRQLKENFADGSIKELKTLVSVLHLSQQEVLDIFFT